MTHNEQLLQVLACHLHGEPCGEWFSSFAPQDWDAFLRLAWQHMVLPVVCVQVRGLASFGAYPRQAAVYRGALRMAAQQAARTQALLHLLPRLEAAGVRYAVWCAGRCTRTRSCGSPGMRICLCPPGTKRPA